MQVNSELRRIVASAELLFICIKIINHHMNKENYYYLYVFWLINLMITIFQKNIYLYTDMFFFYYYFYLAQTKPSLPLNRNCTIRSERKQKCVQFLLSRYRKFDPIIFDDLHSYVERKGVGITRRQILVKQQDQFTFAISYLYLKKREYYFLAISMSKAKAKNKPIIKLKKKSMYKIALLK